MTSVQAATTVAKPKLKRSLDYTGRGEPCKTLAKKPTRNHYKGLRQCLDSISTTYANQ